MCHRFTSIYIIIRDRQKKHEGGGLQDGGHRNIVFQCDGQCQHLSGLPLCSISSILTLRPVVIWCFFPLKVVYVFLT